MHHIEKTLEQYLQHSSSRKHAYTLERMRELMSYLGDPQEQYKSIHIAGTSGKTSTAYFIRGLLQHAGVKTGMTISPHITAINERVQVDDRPLTDAKFAQYFNEFIVLVEKSQLKPTYFEVLIAFAYWVFAKEQVDYVVIETGLGGLLDGTNVITGPDKVCVITAIGLDHIHILGKTVTQIASQKAGIIQPRNHVIVIDQPQPIIRVITSATTKQEATLQIVSGKTEHTDLPEFQKANWALAQAVFTYISDRDGIHQPVLTKDAIKNQQPPARMEIFTQAKKTIILDGAHNQQKVQALVHALQIQYPSKKFAVIFNIVKTPGDKLTDCLESLLPITEQLVVTEFVAAQAKKIGFKHVQHYKDPRSAYDLLTSSSDTLWLITGSLYLARQMRQFIKPRQK